MTTRGVDAQPGLAGLTLGDFLGKAAPWSLLTALVSGMGRDSPLIPRGSCENFRDFGALAALGVDWLEVKKSIIRDI